MACIMINRNKGKFVHELIKRKPYIKVLLIIVYCTIVYELKAPQVFNLYINYLQASDSSSAIFSRLKENSEIPVELPDFAVEPSLSVSVLCSYKYSENLSILHED
jgi:hypothetical protein